MSVFSARPDLTPTASVALMEVDSAVPSPLQRYHQILFPALRLCQALLSSLGGRANLSASAQVPNSKEFTVLMTDYLSHPILLQLTRLA